MTFHHLLQEIGQRLGVGLALDGDGMARLLIDGFLPIDFELDEATNRLLVYAGAGIMPAGREREVVFAELLAANLFSAQLGRCSPGLDTERSELLLWFAVAEGEDPDRVLADLENLLACTERWRHRIVNRGDPVQATPQASGRSAAVLDGYLRA